MPLADHIIILNGNGTIEEQGTWDDLRTQAGYISKVVLKENAERKPRDRVEAKDQVQASPKESEMQHMARKTGDATLYNYYFQTIGSARLLLLSGSLTLYAVLLGAIPYWLRWMAESRGEHMWYYTGIYFALTLGAFLSLSTAVGTIFFVIVPHTGNSLHARLLRTVMYAPQSYFAKTDTGSILNRFSSDMMMLDRQLPFALFQVVQTLFRVLSQCILLAVVQPLIIATLPPTLLAVYIIQKVYLATSRQLRFLDLEARALVNGSFLETLEGVATIRAFGWQQNFTRDNARKLDLSLRPDYLLMCIQRWLNLVLDLIVPGLAIGIIGLAIAFKGTTTGGQLGIALNVVLQTNTYLLRLVQAWTRLETSLGAISRLRAFEQDVLPEDRTDSNKTEPPIGWPSFGAIQFINLSASYTKSPLSPHSEGALALHNINLTIPSGTKVGFVGRTGSGKSSLLLSILRLIELSGDEGTIRIDGLDLFQLPRNAVRRSIITVPQDSMLVMADTIRENLGVAGTDVTEEDMISVLQRVGLWDVLLARITGAVAAVREARSVDAAMGLEAKDARQVLSSASGPAPAKANNDRKLASSAFGNEQEGQGVDDSADEDRDRGGNGENDDNEDDSDTTSTTTTPSTPLDIPMRSLPLSQGQQQMFALARALLMRSSRGRLVLLDEATSNVDGETDRLMQRIMREEFSEHTVITVAHRLETVLDCELVVVMDRGRVVEWGEPGELRGREGGVFRGLIGGKVMI